MKFTTWKRWSRLFAGETRRPWQPSGFRPHVEVLEDRLAPATLHVTNLLGNTSDGSLRGQVAAASDGDTIVFDVSGTITLNGAVSLNKSLTIDASGQSITVSGGTFFPVFIVNTGTSIIQNLNVINGNGANNGSQGGGLYVRSGTTVTLNNVSISNSRSNGAGTGEGGGIYNAGTLTITNSTIANNTVGGGIYNPGDLTVINSTITGNTGSGILVTEGAGASTLRLYNSIIVGNTGTDVNKSFGATGVSGGGNVYGTSLQFSWQTSGSYPDLQTASPNLGTLQNNGGNVSTIAPLAGSPALGAGNPDAPSFGTLPTTDARGVARVVQGTIDSGAFQNQWQLYQLTAATQQTSAVAGTAASINLGAFAYAGTALTSWTVNVNWGDGTSSTFTASSEGALPAQSHTYAAAGSYTVTTSIVDAVNRFSPLTTTVVVNPALAVTTTSLPVATVGNAYFQLVTASGGSGGYRYSTSSTLPAGLSLSSSGVLSGTPTAAFGPADITVEVTDSAGNTTTRDLSLTVNSKVALTPTTLPAFTARAFYAQGLAASGGSGGGYTYTVTGGALPAWLTLDAGTGELSGTPTDATGAPFVFTITATDGNGATGSQVYALSSTRPVNLGGLSFDQWTLNRTVYAGALTVAVTGGTGNYTLSGVTGLPAGVTAALQGGTITLAGKPTRAGKFTIKFTVADSDGVTASRSCTFTVEAAKTLVWTGRGGDAFWSNADNWTGAAPTAGSTLVFGDLTDQKTVVNDLAANTKLAALVFQDDGYDITGAALQLSGGIRSTASGLDDNMLDLAIALAASQVFQVTGDTALDIAGTLSGAFNLTKTGGGELVFSGANNYTGTTTVSAGLLEVADAAALGAGALVVVGASGTLQLDVAGVTFTQALTLGGGRLVDVGGNTWAGRIGLTATSTIEVAADVSLTLTGVISGVGGLTKTGAGTLVYNGATSNTYAGATTIHGGVLQLAGNQQIADARRVNVNAAGVFDLNGFDERIGSLVLTGGAVTTGAGTLTLGGNLAAVAAPTSATISGQLNLGGATRTVTVADGAAVDDLVISAAIGNGGLTKAGTGTLILSGVNTYTGLTTVNAGTLGGSGVLAALRVNAAGLLAPGAAGGTAVLNTRNVTLAAGADYRVTLNGTTAGADYDQLNASGTVNLTGAVLAVELNFTPTVGTTFTIIQATAPIVGTFTGLAEGATLTANGLNFTISYQGNAVVLTALP